MENKKEKKHNLEKGNRCWQKCNTCAKPRGSKANLVWWRTGERHQAKAGNYWANDKLSGATFPPGTGVRRDVRRGREGDWNWILGQEEGRTSLLGHQRHPFLGSCSCAQCELVRFLKIKWQSWDYLQPGVSSDDLINSWQYSGWKGLQCIRLQLSSPVPLSRRD